MGNGLGWESRPFAVVEEAVSELIWGGAPPWPLKGLNYPESWGNLTGASALQERKREKREWCSGALSMRFAVSAQPGLVPL